MRLYASHILRGAARLKYRAHENDRPATSLGAKTMAHRDENVTVPIRKLNSQSTLSSPRYQPAQSDSSCLFHRCPIITPPSSISSAHCHRVIAPCVVSTTGSCSEILVGNPFQFSAQKSQKWARIRSEQAEKFVASVDRTETVVALPGLQDCRRTVWPYILIRKLHATAEQRLQQGRRVRLEVGTWQR